MIEQYWWKDITYFKREEFRCPCGECDGFPVEPDESLVRSLDEIRKAWQQPMHINSGVRCSAHNHEVGGSPDSAHLKGFAADVAISNSTDRYEFIWYALAGFHRIGVGESLIHCDKDPARSARVLWLYRDK